MNLNFKPNYLSLMNYLFQLRGIPAANRLDYSQNDLPDLNENSLNENVGIQDGTDNTLYFCPTGTQSQVPGTGAIDWDCDGTIENPVSANINGDQTSSGGAILSTLTGFDDWPQVVRSLPFQTQGDFQDGVHLDTRMTNSTFRRPGTSSSFPARQSWHPSPTTRASTAIPSARTPSLPPTLTASVKI